MKIMMKVNVFILTSLLVTLLAGCNNNDDNNDEDNKAARIKEHKIMLSVDGVGPINASTPFNMHQITLAFQNYSVTEYTQFTKSTSSPVIRVSENGNPLILINPDSNNKKIFSIFILSDEIGNSLGHEIGSLYKAIYTYEETEPCIAGSDDFMGKVLCMAPKTENILYVFSGTWDGPKNEIPPTAILAEWKLNSIVWKP